MRQCEKFLAKGATAGSIGISRGEISVSGHQVLFQYNRIEKLTKSKTTESIDKLKQSKVFSQLKFESGVHRVQRCVYYSFFAHSIKGMIDPMVRVPATLIPPSGFPQQPKLTSFTHQPAVLQCCQSSGTFRFSL